MPPFRLEPPDRQPHTKRQQKILFTKGTYNKDVKITDWERYLESHPLDNDPYCPGSLNYFLAHHNHLGVQPNDPLRFKSVTHSMLEQIHDKQDSFVRNEQKHIFNFYTFKDSCQLEDKRPICPTSCAADYSTTMQDSYLPPRLYVTQRFALPATPYLLNRRFQEAESSLSSFKFFDDGYKEQTCLLQKYKASRHVSYNPMTGKYTDGSEAVDPKPICNPREAE